MTSPKQNENGDMTLDSPSALANVVSTSTNARKKPKMTDKLFTNCPEGHIVWWNNKEKQWATKKLKDSEQELSKNQIEPDLLAESYFKQRESAEYKRNKQEALMLLAALKENVGLQEHEEEPPGLVEPSGRFTNKDAMEFIIRDSMERCTKCSKSDREAELMLCDGCEVPCHFSCAGLQSVPDADWFCELCNRTTLAGNNVRGDDTGDGDSDEADEDDSDDADEAGSDKANEDDSDELDDDDDDADAADKSYFAVDEQSLQDEIVKAQLRAMQTSRDECMAPVRHDTANAHNWAFRVMTEKELGQYPEWLPVYESDGTLQAFESVDQSGNVVREAVSFTEVEFKADTETSFYHLAKNFKDKQEDEAALRQIDRDAELVNNDNDDDDEEGDNVDWVLPEEPDQEYEVVT